MKGKITQSSKGTKYYVNQGGVKGFVEVTKKQYDKFFPDKPVGGFKTNSIKGWPRKSDAIGCHPDQKAETEAALAKIGVPTEITATGEAVIRDNQHQRALCKALNIVNYDGGYGSITG